MDRGADGRQDSAYVPRCGLLSGKEKRACGLKCCGWALMALVCVYANRKKTVSQEHRSGKTACTINKTKLPSLLLVQTTHRLLALPLALQRPPCGFAVEDRTRVHARGEVDEVARPGVAAPCCACVRVGVKMLVPQDKGMLSGYRASIA